MARNTSWLALCAVTAALSSAEAADDPVFLLVNARNPTQAIGDSIARNMALGQVSFWQGVVPVVVFVRPATSPSGKVFFDWLGMRPEAYSAHWQRRQLSGRGLEPRAIDSVEELVAAVAANAGAIGFVRRSEIEAVPASSKIRMIALK